MSSSSENRPFIETKSQRCFIPKQNSVKLDNIYISSKLWMF